MEIDLRWRKILWIPVILTVIVLVALLNTHFLVGRGVQEARLAREVARDYLDGALTPDNPHITERMAADVARLTELRPTTFEAFTTRAIVPARGKNRAYVVMGARYRSPAGETYVGEVSVAMVRDGNAWKVDRIWTRPLLRVTDTGAEVPAY